MPAPTCTVTWKRPFLSLFAVATFAPEAPRVTLTVAFGKVLPTIVTSPAASDGPVSVAVSFADARFAGAFFDACPLLMIADAVCPPMWSPCA